MKRWTSPKPVTSVRFLLRTPECPYKKVSNNRYACFEIYRAVCGTDDITYSNECELCSAKLTQQDLGVKTDWQCAKDECEGAQPDQMCTLDMNPVCGSDFVTYENSCVFCRKWATNKELYIMARTKCWD
ncbi:double-headed protease inhibitor, submandibular gland-like isoform X2 [Hyperolius riggenbachi]|uniref:double-headed protease inhibitor, submandibular gland-like isoform X2 n=1 Tax=Hyperolius riggenbachi TaxID=752182 RepID=UPI0035A2E1A4